MAPPLHHGHCKHHGGSGNSGPKTAEGKARIAAAQVKRWEKYRLEKLRAELFD